MPQQGSHKGCPPDSSLNSVFSPLNSMIELEIHSPFVVHIDVFNKTAWTISFSFLHPSIKFSVYYGPGAQYLNDQKEPRSMFLVRGLDTISVLAGVTMKSMVFSFAFPAVWLYQVILTWTVRPLEADSWQSGFVLLYCHLDESVSQDSLPHMLPVRMGHRKHFI